VDLLDALYDVLVAMIATVLTAGIAAAQGTETHRPVPSAVPIALPQARVSHNIRSCIAGEWQQRGADLLHQKCPHHQE